MRIQLPDSSLQLLVATTIVGTMPCKADCCFSIVGDNFNFFVVQIYKKIVYLWSKQHLIIIIL